MSLRLISFFRYFAERGTWDEVLGIFINVDGDPSQFSVRFFFPLGVFFLSKKMILQSIPAAAWFVLVSEYFIILTRFPNYFTNDSSPLAITTVGYGEITPRSFLGRLITLPILVFGLLLITLPSFVLGREFSLVWEKMTRDSVRIPS